MIVTAASATDAPLRLQIADVFTAHIRIVRLPRPIIVLLVFSVAVPTIRLLSIRLTNNQPLGIWYVLGVAIPLASQSCLIICSTVLASITSWRTESGIRQQRLLDGEPEIVQVVTDVLLVLVGYLTLELLGLGFLCAAAEIDQLSSNSSVAVSGEAGWPEVGNFVLLIAGSAVMAAAVGSLIGVLSQRMLTATVLTLVTMIVATQLELAGQTLPGTVWVYDALPTSIMTLAGQGPSSTQPSQFIVAGISAIGWPVAALIIVSFGGTRGLRLLVRTVQSRPAPNSPAPSFSTYRRAWIRGLRSVSILMCLVLAGFFGPVALRDEIPWSLRPEWRLDVANHRSSLDIASRFLTLVRTGRSSGADALSVGGSAEQLLGPYVKELQNGSSIQTELGEGARSDPGTVYVNLSYGGGFAVCESRFSGGWRITGVSYTGVCPPATVK